MIDISLSASRIDHCHHSSGLHYYCLTSICLGTVPAQPPTLMMTHFPKKKALKSGALYFQGRETLIANQVASLACIEDLTSLAGDLCWICTSHKI